MKEPKRVKPVQLRPPAWTKTGYSFNKVFDSSFVIEQQRRHLRRLISAAEKGDWDSIHCDHFDWWQFPLDDGSKGECNLKGEHDIAALLADSEWLEAYRESLRIVSRSFGWDIDHAGFVKGGPHWQDIPYSNRDVRLYKMIRSTWLFRLDDYFKSLQAFAKQVDDGEGFRFGSIELGDIYEMSLPR